MVAWFLIAIGTIAFFAYIAVTGVTAVDTTGTFAGRAETIRRIDSVTSALIARSTAIQNDGIVYAPAGVAGTNEYMLPTDLQASGITSFGSRFQYCPMGLPLSGQNGSVAYQGGSYGISTAALNGISYVVSGRMSTAAANDPNVIGFVIAQLTPTGTMPGCAQIARNGETYTAPNGIVRVMRRSQISETDASRVSDGGTWYVAPSANGDGRSMSSPASLPQALAAYRSSLGGPFTIRLANGSYGLEGNPLDQTLTAITPKKESSALVLIGAGTVTVNTSAISVPGNLELRNVRVQNSAVVVTEGHTLKMTDSTTASLLITGRSRLLMNGTNNVVGSPGVPAAIQILSGSTGTINDTANLYFQRDLSAVLLNSGGSLTTNATVNTAGATINVSSVTGNSTTSVLFNVAKGSALTLKDTVVNIGSYSTYAFANLGEFTTANANLNFNSGGVVALQTGPGAVNTLFNLNIQGGSVPNYGFASQSSTKLVGNGSIRTAIRCWTQDGSSLHRLSQPGVVGATTNVSADETWAGNVMTDPPTNLQVRDYQAMVQRNQERADLRTRVQWTGGNFTCDQASGNGWQTCAGEGGYCDLTTLPNYATTRPITVRYGINDKWIYMTTARGFPCNNTVFTDPAVGIVKVCQVTS